MYGDENPVKHFSSRFHCSVLVEDQRLSLYSSALSVQNFRNTRNNKKGGLEAASDLSQGLISPEVCGRDPVLKDVLQRDSLLKS